jgi:hypothetical protein
MKSRPAASARTICASALNSLSSINSISSSVSVAMVLLFLWLAATSGLAAGRNPNPRVLPAGSVLRGKTYGDWVAAWWTWALRFPLEQNPITDATGAYGSAGQRGPVWFLAGTFGGTAERSLTVPAGKRIIFPLFNVFNDYSCPDANVQPAPGQTLEEFLTEGAQTISALATGLFAEVDGVPIQNLWDYRAHSDMRMFAKHPSWSAVDPCLTEEPQPAVAGGYWLMLAPLPRGQHTLRFGSTALFGEDEFAVHVTYHLTVD